jgi:hypothetical protein
MPSLGGFKTWLDYELLLIGLGIGVVGLVLVGEGVLGILRDIPFTSTELVFALVGVSVVVLLGSVWWVGRYR